jgi:histidyl-tRNA synthetase
MAEKIPQVSGMRDVLPLDTYAKAKEEWLRIGHFHAVEEAARRIFPLYGYHEARTPILERTELFARGIGEGTDIVGKEMFTFEDGAEGKTTSVTLRPEGTAALVRAYVQHSVQQAGGEAKWWYQGPMFRRERQQKGRYRQFTQIGMEAFNSPGPRVDVEQIELLHRWLTTLGLKCEMRINTLGDGDTRPKWREALQAYLRQHKEKLSKDSQERLETNPIRVLDSKFDDPAILAGAPQIDAFLSDDARKHFDGVKDGLTRLGVPFVIDPRLVRGLDYYTRTTFEAVALEGLGAQSTVAGGGRYDGLVRMLGGGDVPGVGFAAGVERIALLCAAAGQESVQRPVVYIAMLEEAGEAKADVLAQQLRSAGLAAEVSLRRSNAGNQLKRADALKARFALVLGESELSTGRAKLKELATGAQHEVELSDLVSAVQRLLV